MTDPNRSVIEIKTIKHNIIQMNIRGIINPSNMNKAQKCKYIMDILRNKNIDIALLQEWSLLRKEFKTNATFYKNFDEKTQEEKIYPLHFPIEHFH